MDNQYFDGGDTYKQITVWPTWDKDTEYADRYFYTDGVTQE